MANQQTGRAGCFGRLGLAAYSGPQRDTDTGPYRGTKSSAHRNVAECGTESGAQRNTHARSKSDVKA